MGQDNDQSTGDGVLEIGRQLLKGTPGAVVVEDPQRWRSRDVRLLRFSLNGQAVEVAAPTHWTLLEVLRYRLDRIGSKQGCDKGDCGACTVRIDGEAVLSCITLAAEVEGRAVETVEALSTGRADEAGVHPLVREFDRHGAAQCGFCTPGILMSAVAFLDQRVASGAGAPARAEIAAAIGGNLCRCTGYVKILDAIGAAWPLLAPSEAAAESASASDSESGNTGAR